MSLQKTLALALLACAALPLVVKAQGTAPDLARRRNFTAQQKPRVAVMKFENTNKDAEQQAFGASVSAMLITFLKRKSQVVVVERQNLDAVLEEWKKRDTGLAAKRTDPSGDPLRAQPQQQLLASIEAILDGRVTVLGDVVEVDARLISPEDAHIIAAGHQSGPRNLLRETVERLGIELEQGFLKPYYGNLTVTVNEPTNVRIFLTPILSINASDDERPAIELDRTASPQARQVVYEKWITAPTVATIGSLLGGWYTVKVERPGYVPIGTENGRIVLPEGPGAHPVQLDGGSLSSEQQPFVVEIKAFETQKWPLDARPVRLVKKGGSVLIRARREFIDQEFQPATDVRGLRTFLRAETRDPAQGPKGKGPALLEINDRTDLEIGPDDAGGGSGQSAIIQARLDDITTCVYAPSRPIFEDFSGGRLMVEDYHKLSSAAERRLPVGSYRLSAVMPEYWVRTSSVFDVADKVEDRVLQIDLKRMTGTVTVTRTEPPAPGNHIVFEGRETKYRHSVALDFTGKKDVLDLPVDSYTVTTDLPGFDQWKSTFVLASDPRNTVMGTQPARAEADGKDCIVKEGPLPAAQFAFDLKTQPWLAGRLQRMNQFTAASLSPRREFSQLLDAVMAAEEQRRPESNQSANDGQSFLVAHAVTTGTPDDLLKYTQWYLSQIDLLYLDNNDMQRLLKLPQAAKLVREFIDGGGAVYCFVSTPGDYAPILGAPLNLELKPEARNEIELRQGDVPQLQMDLKLEFKTPRDFPTLRSDKKEPITPWRVVAYRRKGRKEPAILEKGDMNGGGYVLVWLDALDRLPIHDLTQEALTTVEKRALTWAQFLMYRRVGPASPQRADAENKLATLNFTMKGEAKIAPPPR